MAVEDGNMHQFDAAGIQKLIESRREKICQKKGKNKKQG